MGQWWGHRLDKYHGDCLKPLDPLCCCSCSTRWQLYALQLLTGRAHDGFLIIGAIQCWLFTQMLLLLVPWGACRAVIFDPQFRNLQALPFSNTAAPPPPPAPGPQSQPQSRCLTQGTVCVGTSHGQLLSGDPKIMFCWTSQVAQWIGIHPPMQGTWV